MKKVEADAAAYAIRVKAEAEAEANKLVAESLTADLISYSEIEKWDGQLPVYMNGEGGTTLPILNLNEAAGK